MKKPAVRPKGLVCPTCLLKLRTMRVVPRADGTVQRRKRCLKCPYTITTYERARGAAS